MSRRKKTKYCIPEGVVPNGTMLSGNKIEATQIGQVYSSSLEIHLEAKPQFSNAGDLLANLDPEVEKVFKRRFPHGTFGSFLSDYTADEYRLCTAPTVIEIEDKEMATNVANFLDLDYHTQAIKAVEESGIFTYNLKDGHKFNYKQALEYIRGYRAHNSAVQAEIDKFKEEHSLLREYTNDGRKVRKAYTKSQLDHISSLSKRKKSLTGLVVKIDLKGKHTLSTNKDVAFEPVNQEKFDVMVSDADYVEKHSHLRGTIKERSIIVPIQTLAQLKWLINYLSQTGWLMTESMKAALENARQFTAIKVDQFD